MVWTWASQSRHNVTLIDGPTLADRFRCKGNPPQLRPGGCGNSGRVPRLPCFVSDLIEVQ